VNPSGQQPQPESQHVTKADGAKNRSDESEPKDDAIEHIFLDVARVAIEGLQILRFLEVVEHVAELNRPEAAQMRTVGITFDLGKGMVLAMHRDPLTRTKPGRQPQTESKQEAHGRMEFQRFVRRTPVKKDGRAENRNLRNEGRREKAPGELPEHATA
jgi:hypothetical protein